MITETQVPSVLADADPIVRAAARCKSVEDEIRDALIRAESCDVVAPTAPDRRRPSRRQVFAGAALAACVAAAIAVPLRTGSQADPSDRDQLYRLAAVVRTSDVVASSTRTGSTSTLQWIDTTRGRAWYRQSSTMTVRLTATTAYYDYDFDPPHFLSRQDAERAQHPLAGQQIQQGRSSSTDPCGTQCTVIPADVLAGLPTNDPRALVHAVGELTERGVIGGAPPRPQGPPNAATAEMLGLLQSPGVSGQLRATAIEALASSAGIRVVGHRVIAGRNALELMTTYPPNEAVPQRFAIDTTDGLILATSEVLTAQKKSADGYPVPVGTLVYSETTDSVTGG